MVIKGNTLEEIDYRTDYGVGPFQDRIGHFVVRVTTPENPFMPEKHGEARFWFVLEGEAVVTEDGEQTVVETGDLVVLGPWTQHSLQTETRVRWICFG
jgi:mannose-6-phosphate isomerase-like protein (cupin superfamily)